VAGIQWRNVHTGHLLNTRQVMDLDSSCTHIFMDAKFCSQLQRVDDHFRSSQPVVGPASSGTQQQSPSDVSLLSNLWPKVSLVWGANQNLKSDVVRSFQKSGQVVAVCGHGFEDSLAMGAADVSVAGVMNQYNCIRSKQAKTASAPKCVDEWIRVPDFVCRHTDDALPHLISVLRHGSVCLSSMEAVLFFGLVMALVHAISTSVINIWAPQYGINSNTQMDARLLVIYALVAGLVFVSPSVSVWRPTFAMLSSRRFTARKLGWISGQCALGLISLSLLFFFSEPSLSSEHLNKDFHGNGNLAYPYYYETPQGGLFFIWSIWFLTTLAFSSKIVLLERISNILTWQVLSAFVAMCGIWAFLIILLWGGPSGLTCTFDINCDNEHSWIYFRKCIFGPQLPELKDALGNNFVVPSPATGCRFYETPPQDSALVGRTVIQTLPFFPVNICSGPHNCIDNAARFATSIILSSMSVISVSLSVMLQFHRDRN